MKILRMAHVRLAHLRVAHLRIGLGVLVGAYGLSNLAPIGSNALYKAGGLRNPPADLARMVPLWEATPWWQLAVWTGIVALLLVVAWRLIRGRTALGLYVLGLLAQTAFWWVMHAGAAYQQAFTPAELQMDYDMLLAIALVGVLIWWTERRPLGETASA